MKYQMFTYAITDDGELSDLNTFLSSHRILDVKHYSANDGRNLVFLVEYLEGENRESTKKTPRVDYREKLSETEFSVFSQLRDLRKNLANQNGVPVYNIFTNAQLADMVERKVQDKSTLSKVPGVGTARVEKYGERFIALLKDLRGSTK